MINNLTHYLEALHQPENISRGLLTKDHTALLLNSYARLDDKERIDAFLEVGFLKRNYIYPFLSYSCISVELAEIGSPAEHWEGVLRLHKCSSTRRVSSTGPEAGPTHRQS